MGLAGAIDSSSGRRRRRRQCIAVVLCCVVAVRCAFQPRCDLERINEGTEIAAQYINLPESPGRA
jgi:hypothetical protein